MSGHYRAPTPWREMKNCRPKGPREADEPVEARPALSPSTDRRHPTYWQKARADE
jgi:hypothetical protein